MPLKYLDTTYNYSDPATTNLKYLRRVDLPDGTHTTKWDAPSDRYKFYDSEGRWSVPDVKFNPGSWNRYTWDEINTFGQNKVVGNPGKYRKLLHTTKTVPQTEPVGKDIVYEIVDICHTDWGDDHAFVWMPKDECLINLAHQNSHASGASYKGSQIRTALRSGGNLFISFPSDLKSVWKDIHYKYQTRAGQGGLTAGGGATTETAKLVIPSVVEVGLIDSISRGPGGYIEEGTVLQTFTSAEDSDRIRNGNGVAVAWWLRSLSSWIDLHSNFVYVSIKGALANNGGTDTKQWVCPCFAV